MKLFSIYIGGIHPIVFRDMALEVLAQKPVDEMLRLGFMRRSFYNSNTLYLQPSIALIEFVGYKGFQGITPALAHGIGWTRTV